MTTNLMRVTTLSGPAASDEQKNLLMQGYHLTDSQANDDMTMFDMSFTSDSGESPVTLRCVDGDRRFPVALCYEGDHGRLVQFRPDGINAAWTDQDRQWLANDFAFEFGPGVPFYWVPVLYGDILMQC